MPEVEPQFPEPLADMFGQLASIAGTVAILGVVLLALSGFAVFKLDVRVPAGLIWGIGGITAVSGVLWLLVIIGVS